ncbi:DUF1593-domain-containing protein, partial [Aureobasidium melanogenum]
MMSSLLHLALAWLLCLGVRSAPLDSNTSNSSHPVSYPRIFVATDISNEPDDQMSLVRLLLHSDILSIQGITTTTSYWLNDTTYPEHILDVIAAYENVTTNLNAHTESTFPSADSLRSVVKAGHSVYGLAALNNGTLSSGAELLISAAGNSNETLHILLWGGANVLAEALDHVNRTSSQSELDAFVGKLHVYSISDQDNAGPWIRKNFPQIPYIASVHGFNMYNLAAWTGISGDILYAFDAGGPDTTLVDDTYIRNHFQLGPLGAKYPNRAYIMEGDSPSLLSVIPNGLNVPSHPEFGGWGGRYILSDISGASNHYADTIDRVVGVSGNTLISNHATIWRWRSAYQNEMSARVQWSLSSNYSAAVHPPKINLNGTTGTEPYPLSVQPEQSIILDASATVDPDSNSSSTLTFEWMHYKDITASNQYNANAEVPQLNVACLNQACSTVQTKMPNETLACPQTGCQTYHVILSVKGQSATPITRYRRIMFDMQEASG